MLITLGYVLGKPCSKCAQISINIFLLNNIYFFCLTEDKFFEVRDYLERLVEGLVDGGLDDVCLTPLSTHPQCAYIQTYRIRYRSLSTCNIAIFLTLRCFYVLSTYRHVNMLEVPRTVGHDANGSHTHHHKRYYNSI